MIEKLKLTNFRKVEDDTMVFGPGLQLIKAPNEGSKSTRLEAIAYALFGSKALRTNFSDTVTWGRPENSLRVELTLNLDGRRLTFSRGKSGAEVIEDGRVIVTGQNEVSTYATGLLGCDSTAASNLIIASQNAMRGSLEQGPKATAEMIERLADFDLFDVLIERMQTNLLIGSPAAFEARLREAEERLEAFTSPVKPDEAAHNAWLDENRKEAGRIERLLADDLRPALKAAERAHEGAAEKARAHTVAKEDLDRAERTLYERQATLSVYYEEAEALHADPSELAAAKADLADLEKAAGAAEAYRLFQTLPTCANEFEGSEEAFQAWLDSRRKDLAKTNEEHITKQGRIRELQARIVSASVCGFCGQDVSAFPDVAKKNAEIEDEIVALGADVLSLRGDADGISAEIKAGTEIDHTCNAVKQVVAKLGDLVDVDQSVVPPKVSWRGAVPGKVDLSPARARVAGLEKEAERKRELLAKASALDDVLKDDAEIVGRLRTRLHECPYPDDAGELYEAYQRALSDVAEADGTLSSLKSVAEQRRTEFGAAMAAYTAQAGQRQRLEDAVVQAKADIESLAFNNTLLKKVRAARPVIADKLWNTVLAAVSTMFSQMRGEASMVSKDNGGFKVNGQPIEALSGSTLDILGLAIRTALVKTFIPHAPFLLLDEAAAACDEDRTSALLGFIAGSGFTQTVLVTHESASEAVADNVIQL